MSGGVFFYFFPLLASSLAGTGMKDGGQRAVPSRQAQKKDVTGAETKPPTKREGWMETNKHVSVSWRLWHVNIVDPQLALGVMSSSRHRTGIKACH